MIAEEDDDTHICLKCHTTIHGLENYVTHRKSGCNTQVQVHTKPRPLSPLIAPDEPDFSLKADDFFSLLELQSSSKKSSMPIPSGGKTSSSGVLTRSKATAVIQASNLNRASDWIGGHQLRELGNEDNQTKLINAVDNISGHIKKDEPKPRTHLTYEVELDEDYNDDYEDDDEEFDDECQGPPRSHTGGKWKPSNSPIQWLRPTSLHTQDYRHEWDNHNPPPSYTGGKWKPMLPPQRTISENDEEEDKNIPPPGHTKGKWIPGRNNIDINNSHQILEEIPPLRKSSGTVQYWCGPCNRHLASKIVYDRHLKSELHFKRTLHEREFESTSEYLNQQQNVIKTHSRAEGKRKIKRPDSLWNSIEIQLKNKSDNELKNLKSRKYSSIKCEVCRSKVLTYLMGKHLISHYHCKKRNLLKPVSDQMVLDNIHSIILQSPFQCSTCRFYCNSDLDFLNHWRSLNHRNISKKIKGYFSCGFCKFHSDNNDNMEEHLISNNHREVVSVINKSVPIIIRNIIPIKCVSCAKEFRYNMELRKHCQTENHVMSTTSTDKYQEKHNCPDCNLLLKSNKALQRHLLRRHNKNYFFCTTCSLTFNSENESKLHRKTQQHKYAVLTKQYKNGLIDKDIRRNCEYCSLQFRNILFLKEHLRKEHPEHYFNCPQCGEKFTLSQEVTKHIKLKQCTFDSSSNVAYFNCEKCPYKVNSEADFLFHVTLHTEPLAVYDTNDQSSSKKPPVNQYKCPVCDKYFRKSSLRCHIRQHTNERPFKCQFCKAAYTRKSNLMDHIKRQHCHENNQIKSKLYQDDEDFFERHDDVNEINRNEQLQNHVRIVSNAETEKNKRKTEQERPKETRDKRFLCAFCGKNFMKKFTLLQHIKVHTGRECKCPHEGCTYKGRTTAELKVHISTHSKAKSFNCQHCSFSTKTKSQLTRHVKVHHADKGKKYSCTFCSFSSRIRCHLKRHLRLHSGAKPYKCPHCTYTCNNLENLRKHVLSTNKHPGKSIYECNLCEEPNEFATNFSKEFRKHLLTSHSDQFHSIKEASSYVVIYNADEDSELVTNHNKKSMECNDENKEDFKQISSDFPVSSINNEIIKSEVTTKNNATITNNSTILLTSAQDTNHPRTVMDSELLSMVVVTNPRDDVIYVEMPPGGNESWTMEGYYGVEESGTLVPFNTEDGDLLVEHFDNENQ